MTEQNEIKAKRASETELLAITVRTLAELVCYFKEDNYCTDQDAESLAVEGLAAASEVLRRQY